MKSPSIDDLFLRELASRDVRAARLSAGTYRLTHTARGEVEISLDNIGREIERDGDPKRMASFVDAILAAPPVPRLWAEAKKGLRLSAEPTSLKLGNAVRDDLSVELARVLAYTDADEAAVVYVDPAQLAVWKTTEEKARLQAAANLRDLLADTEIEFSLVAGHPMALFVTNSVFKASLIFAPNLKKLVVEKLGWPVVAIAPCRDFLMVFSAARLDDLLARLGAIVLREFDGSGYPITSEVLEISDAGLRALGAFKPASKTKRAAAPAGRKKAPPAQTPPKKAPPKHKKPRR